MWVSSTLVAHTHVGVYLPSFMFLCTRQASPAGILIPCKQSCPGFLQEAEKDTCSLKRGEQCTVLMKPCTDLMKATYVITWVYMFQVSANTDSSMSGYLQRSKGNKKQGKRLWFVIKDKVLYTYAASEVWTPAGILVSIWSTINIHLTLVLCLNRILLP